MKRRNRYRRGEKALKWLWIVAGVLFIIAVVSVATSGDGGIVNPVDEPAEEPGIAYAGITERLLSLESGCITAEARGLEVVSRLGDDLPHKLPEECLADYFGYVPTDAELLEFYQIVQDEAGNTESEDGIGAVADVVANRCRSDKFPDTIHGVLYQPGAFQPIGDGTFGRFEITELTYEICDDHISEGIMDPEILYFTAGGYNPYCEPLYQIGNHYFGK